MEFFDYFTRLFGIAPAPIPNGEAEDYTGANFDKRP